MAFRKIGDWDKTRHLVNNLSKEIVDARDKSLKRLGLKAEAIAVGHISKQDLGWRPLKAATISNKVRKGQSENILVATSSYFQAITSWVEGDTAYAGVKKGVKHKGGGLTEDIAAIHEYGSRSGRIPKRPLWKPTFDEARAWHYKENSPVQIFLKAMKKYGI